MDDERSLWRFILRACLRQRRVLYTVNKANNTFSRANAATIRFIPGSINPSHSPSSLLLSRT